jgi:hypothetical protein
MGSSAYGIGDTRPSWLTGRFKCGQRQIAPFERRRKAGRELAELGPIPRVDRQRPARILDINGIVDLFEGTPEFVPFSITPATASTPEPGSIGLLLAGMAFLFWLRRRRIAA